MTILAAAQNTQPDYVALAMVLALAVIIAIMAIRKRRSYAPADVVAPAPVPEVKKPVAPGSAGQIKLNDVEPKTAAMLMAIVANKLDKPLNELRFISIKEVK